MNKTKTYKFIINIVLLILYFFLFIYGYAYNFFRLNIWKNHNIIYSLFIIYFVHWIRVFIITDFFDFINDLYNYVFEYPKNN